MFNVNNQVKFKTWMLRSSICDYRDAYTLVSATITVPQKKEQEQNQTIGQI